MIEPHSAQLGASAWVWNDTFEPPRFRVIGAGPPPPFVWPLPLAAWPFAWPLVAMTASSDFGASASIFSDVAVTAAAFGVSSSVAVGRSIPAPPSAPA